LLAKKTKKLGATEKDSSSDSGDSDDDDSMMDKETRFKDKIEKVEAKRNAKIEAMKKMRTDARMRGVMINDGSGADGAPRDKKFA